MRPRAVISAFCFLLSALSSSAFAGGQATVTHAAIATSSPIATKVGVAVLKSGGSAVDAAVAVALALGVLQPHACGIGGGGIALFYEAKTGAVWTLDFLSVSPAAVKPENVGTKTGALSAGAPGLVAGLDALHRKFGRQPWKELVQPAIALARDGVPINGELEAALTAANIPLPANKTLEQKDLATTLGRIAAFGARELYDGETTTKLVDSVRAAGGVLSFRDMSEYAPIWRAPIKLRFNGFDIYAPPAPSSGALVIGESLNILATYDLASRGFQSVNSLHLIAEASRRASIDRDRVMADPAGARIPYRDLLATAHAEAWRSSIIADRVTATSMLADAATKPASDHTTHVTIADAEGNIVAMTLTIGDALGSRFVASGTGILLENTVASFSDRLPNSLAGSKRPSTPLSPTLVMRGDHPLIALGTNGGAAIPMTILDVLLNVLVYQQPVAEAIAARRYTQGSTPDQIDYESGAPEATTNALNAMGHGIARQPSIGDVNAIWFEDGKMIAVADPRHPGAAGGY
jgi:gamma-glutamyltranspeptidase/glutathione hydrolase